MVSSSFRLHVLLLLLLFIALISAASTATIDDTNCPTLYPDFTWPESLQCENCRLFFNVFKEFKRTHGGDEHDFYDMCAFYFQIESSSSSEPELRQKPRTGARYWVFNTTRPSRTTMTSLPFDTVQDREAFQDLEGAQRRRMVGAASSIAETVFDDEPDWMDPGRKRKYSALPEPLDRDETYLLPCYPYFLQRECTRFAERFADAVESTAWVLKHRSATAFCSSSSIRLCERKRLARAAEHDRVRWLKWMGAAKLQHTKGAFDVFVPTEDNEDMMMRNPYAVGGEKEGENELLRDDDDAQKQVKMIKKKAEMAKRERQKKKAKAKQDED
eukprot:PhM_4_TR3472/c3_g1_i1/m.77876